MEHFLRANVKYYEERGVDPDTMEASTPCTTDDAVATEPGPLSASSRKRKCEERERYFDGLEVAKVAIKPCTAADVVPPEPAVAIEALAPPAPQGEALVAEVASLKEKIKTLKQRLYKEEGHRLEAQDKLTYGLESAEQEIAEAQRQVTLRQEQCAAALTTEYALRAKVKELRATITTLKQTADLLRRGGRSACLNLRAGRTDIRSWYGPMNLRLCAARNVATSSRSRSCGVILL